MSITIVSRNAGADASLGNRAGIQVTVPKVTDPLAGLPFFARWQTHVPGSNALLGNLFQDSGLTTPATAANDPVGGFNSVLSGSGAMTQSDGSHLPVLGFDSSVPFVWGKVNVGFYNLPDISALTEGEMFLLVKCVDSNSGYTISGGAAPDQTFLGFGNISVAPTATFDNFGFDGGRHGPINGPVLNVWTIYNVSSKLNEWRCAFNGGADAFTTASNTPSFNNAAALGYGNSFNGFEQIIALFFFSTVLTPTQRALVNTYLQELIPGAAPNDSLTTPDGSQYFVTPDSSQYFSQP